MTLPTILALAVLITPLSQAPNKTAPAAAAEPRAQLRLAVQITRTDEGAAAADKPAPRVIGAPVLSTQDRTTGSISVAGGDLSFGLSLSPTLEPGNRATLLWNLRLAGKGVPGTRSLTMSGASRVTLNRNEPVTEVTLRDPATGRTSTFAVTVKASVATESGGGAGAAAPEPPK